jgi:hypothetical protein
MDDKKWIADDGITMYAYGDYQLPDMSQMIIIAFARI